jgi:taurine dioxygenase
MATALDRAQHTTVTRLGPHLGAELHGVDLSRPFTAEALATIRAAFRADPVLVMRGQDMKPENLIAIGDALGYIEPHSILQYRHPQFEQLSYVTNTKPDGTIDEYGQNKRAVDWHIDGTFKAKPDCITFLYSIAAPTIGGPTEFTSMYAAYDALSPALKARIADLQCFHKRGEGWRCTAPPPPLTEAQKATGEFEGNVHPLVITHPESGRKSIYIGPTHTSHVVGLPRAESDALLDELLAVATRPEFMYRHHWKVGDLVMWDQRATMHRAGGGTPRDQKRIMLRAMVVSTLRAGA